MILGQFVETGRRYCECRPAEYLPREPEFHAALAYTVTDRLEGCSVEVSNNDALEQFERWLADHRAVAYILIAPSRDLAPIELAPPVGKIASRYLAITAATPDLIRTKRFEVHTSSILQPARLELCDKHFELMPVSRRNLFHSRLESLSVPNDAKCTSALTSSGGL